MIHQRNVETRWAVGFALTRDACHKGNTIRLTLLAQPRSKMSRIVKRDTLLGSPDELEAARRELQDEMNAEMEKDWSKI